MRRLLVLLITACSLLTIFGTGGATAQSDGTPTTSATGTPLPAATATPRPSGSESQGSGGGGGLISFTSYAIWINAAIFAVAAGIIWFAGTRLETYTDAIANRTGMGQAFAGLLLLATATSLPEVATTVTASLNGNVELAVHNLLGGVVVQTTLIVVVDILVAKGSITRFTPRFPLLMEGVGLVMILGVALAAMVSGTLAVTDVRVGGIQLGIGVGPFALFMVYLIVMYVTRRNEGQPRWRPVSSDDEYDEDSGTSDQQDRHSQRDEQRQGGSRDRSLTKLGLLFGAAAAAIFVAGWTVARTGEALAVQTGVGSSFIGATLVAIATSLPEVSTATAAARNERYSLAISNIFGSNAFDVSLLFLVALVAGSAVFQAVPSSALFAASLGIIMTCVYLWGLLERRDRTFLRMGWDSVTVALLYIGGLVGLYFLR